MKVLEGFKLRKLGRDYIVTAEGLKRVNFNKMIALNATAAYLWQQIEDGRDFDAPALAAMLVEKYEVSEEVALKDSEILISRWVEAGIIGE